MTAISNHSGDGRTRRDLTLGQDMAAFDRLPQPIKEQLREMSIGWDAVGVRDILRSYGADVTSRVLEKQERDSQVAYHARIGMQ